MTKQNSGNCNKNNNQVDDGEVYCYNELNGSRGRMKKKSFFSSFFYLTACFINQCIIGYPCVHCVLFFFASILFGKKEINFQLIQLKINETNCHSETFYLNLLDQRE